MLTAGRSAVATAAACIAKHKYGCKVVSVVRRKDMGDDEWGVECGRMKAAYGVDLVIAEEQIARTPPRRLMGLLAELGGSGRVPLLLDAVGGKTASLLSLGLTESGYCVTYGGLSRNPISVRAGSEIFNDVKYVGFWLTRFNDERGNLEERVEMLKELAQMAKAGMLVLPELKTFKLEDYEEAFANVGNGEKTCFDCRLSE